MDETAIQEMSWEGHGLKKDKKEQLDVYYSCGDKDTTGLFGCGFAVLGGIREKVLNFKLVNDRICTIRIKAKD